MIQVLSFFAGLFLFRHIAVLAHELAHLLAARLVGWTPSALIVGDGPALLEIHLRGVTVRIGLFPLTGFAYSTRIPLRGLRWRGAIFTLAGPLSDFVLLLATLGLRSVWPPEPPAEFLNPPDLVTVIVVLQAFTLALSLLPLSVRHGDRVLESDGRACIRWLSGRVEAEFTQARQEYTQAVRRYDPQFLFEESWLYRTGREALTKFSTAHRRLSAREFDAAVPIVLELLGTEDFTAGERALQLDQLACIAVIHGDERFLDRAVAWAREAMTLAPEAPTLRGTLGSALVATGQYEEGIALLQPLTEPGNSPFDHSIAAAWLAFAFHQLGDSATAQRWLAESRRVGAAPALADRVEARLSPRAEPSD